MADNKNKTAKVRKSLERTINTGNYENIRIVTDFEIEVEYREASDLMLKATHINNLLLDDFKTTQDQVLKELGLNCKKAFVKNNIVEAEKNRANEDMEKIFPGGFDSI